MKKLFYLFMLLLPLGFITSCSNDDDLPDVNVTATFDNVVDDAGVLYVVKGDTLKLESLTVKSNDGKNAIITSVNYSFYNIPPFAVLFAPYSVNFLTDDLASGYVYPLNAAFVIAQEDKSLANATLQYSIAVVDDASALPGGEKPGKVEITNRLSPK